MPDELLPSSIADDRMKLLDAVVEDRCSGIELSTLLVYLVEHVTASALPELGMQFGSVGAEWVAADEAGKRALLARVLKRRRLSGTTWAVDDALSGAGYVALEWDERPVILRDGSIRHDGTFQHGYARGEVWLIFASGGNVAEVQAIVDRWKRKSIRVHVFWVGDASEYEDQSAYSTVPLIATAVFDFTFDGTFA